MKYVVIVSHGMLAPGLHDAVKMLAGEDSPEVLSTSLLNGMGADEYADNFRKLISPVGPEDEIILFADLVGGSPLSFAANVLAEEGLLGRTLMIGGMNLPLVLTTVLSKDMMELEDIKSEILPDAVEGLKVFEVVSEESADDDI
ncbi:MAG: PTS fructose transporter subunit IIA [Lachnospiraceae bacterium]|jgi:PTS system N-acetylgalactosamine-specific IIA component|nr:PTS fructose transporter subunit IIA [Lachnospiraceae bacterium]